MPPGNIEGQLLVVFARIRWAVSNAGPRGGLIAELDGKGAKASEVVGDVEGATVVVGLC